MAERGRPRAFDRGKALEQAMLLFWEKGFQGAAMSELTAAMGINAPSLYACFGSKEALYREAMALYESGDGAELASAIAAAPTVRDAIEIYLMRSAALFSRPDKPAGCMVVLSVVHAAGTSEETARALRDARTEMQGVLEARLRNAITRGELPGGDPAAIAAFY
ncbi:MAG: TetR/AcrR family transcriptional regulator, partial [Hyphomicrobiales bacterium]